MIVSLVRATFALAILAVFAPAQDRITFTDDRMPGAGEPGWLVFLVVDDLTSEPIAGAEVFLILESQAPIAGEFWFTRKVTSDEHGVVRIPTADIAEQWHFQMLKHPAYGTCTRSENDNQVWRVGRAFEVPVLVRDWRGQPSPGATIGFCGYCGHSPDLANAVTDADGIAVLRGIDPHNHIADIYVQQPGLGLGYRSIEWYPGGPPSLVDCSWSMPLTGKVVDHLGQPVAGAFVGALDVHRGPWGRTAADGSFTILGADPAIGASHVLTAEQRKVYFPTPRRYPVTLQLPDLSDPEAHQGSIDVEEDWRKPVFATFKVRVRFESSGESLVAGTRLPGADSIGGELDTVEVPTTGPFAITLEAEGSDRGRPGERVFAYDDASELPPEPVVLRWFSPTRVVGRVVDRQGRPVPAQIALLPGWKRESGIDYTECADGRFDLRCTDSGMAVLDVVPQVDGLRRRSVFVALPLRGDDQRVDLGDLVVSTEPQLRLTAADGPMSRETVWFSRAGFQEAGEPRSFVLDEDGCWAGPDLQEGDSLVVKGDDESDDGVLPWRMVLRGSGPWQFTEPTGQLDVRVTTSDGKLVVPVVQFADQQLAVKDDLRLRRLPTGPLRLYAGAPGHRTAVVDTVVTDEPRELVISLPAR